MKIGIYLAYHPCGKSFSLKKEGLGRYLAFLIKGFTKNKDEIVIACPRWLVDAIDELIEEENISRDLVKFLVPTDMPFVYKLYLKHMDKDVKIKRKRLKSLQQVTYNLIDYMVDIMICTKNIVIFGGIWIFLAIISVLLLPFFLLFILILVILKGVKRIVSFFSLKSKTETKKVTIKEILRNNVITRKIIKLVAPIFNINTIKDKMRINSAKEIIKKINNMNEPMDVWYCPMAFWEEFNQIKGTKVICAPDLVTTEFPTKFSALDCVKSTQEVKDTITQGTYFITYCDYLKQSLLVEKFAKNKKDVISIPHANNNMLEYINVKNSFQAVKLKDDANNIFVNNIVLPSLINNTVGMEDYLTFQGYGNFPFKDIKYIFYSSQVRPNKNILTLIKAYEFILREKNIPIKLILTGNIEHDINIKNYIIDNRLQYDVLSFYSVTNQQLAALYMKAELVVNPTMYEGGFPFTFGEGMSVGTPSIMSDIPQVIDVTYGYDLEDCIFNPYDYKDMAEKIIYGLEHKVEIYEKQLKLYNKLAERTWEDVCEDYEKAFQYFICQDKEKKKDEVTF